MRLPRRRPAHLARAAALDQSALEVARRPEVAILGVSQSITKPVWDCKAFAPRLMVPLSFSYDHRVIDGASAARFTAYLATLLSDMRRVML